MATGAAATGVAGFAGSVAGHHRDDHQGGVQRTDSDVDAGDLELGDVDQQTGRTEVGGLINVVLQNVNVQALNNVIVNVGGINVNVSDIEILNDNEVQLVLNDVVNLTGNQVAVTLLGTTQQGQRFRAEGSDTIDLDQ